MYVDIFSVLIYKPVHFLGPSAQDQTESEAAALSGFSENALSHD